MWEGGWRLNKDCNILTPTLMAISVVSFSFSWSSNGGPGAQLSVECWLSLPHLVTNGSTNYWGPRGPLLQGGGFPYHIYSPTRLISNSSGLQLVDFLYPPSYIIVQSPTESPTQSLEWHVWSSSSGNNCLAVQRSLSSVASVYECIMDFYLVPFRQLNPPTRFLSITGPLECVTSFQCITLEWHVWPGRRSIYNKRIRQKFSSSLKKCKKKEPFLQYL